MTLNVSYKLYEGRYGVLWRQSHSKTKDIKAISHRRERKREKGKKNNISTHEYDRPAFSFYLRDTVNKNKWHSFIRLQVGYYLWLVIVNFIQSAGGKCNNIIMEIWKASFDWAIVVDYCRINPSFGEKHLFLFICSIEHAIDVLTCSHPL